MNDCTPAAFRAGFLFARPPGEIDMPRASCLERLGACRRVSLVDLVGRAQAGERGARSLEGGDPITRGLVEAIVGHRLDAAGLEEILGEGGARA